jgi:hypothetical protein
MGTLRSKEDCRFSRNLTLESSKANMGLTTAKPETGAETTNIASVSFNIRQAAVKEYRKNLISIKNELFIHFFFILCTE